MHNTPSAQPRFSTTRLPRVVRALPIAALLLTVVTVPAAPQGASMLRGATGAQTRMVGKALRNAIIPRLEIRRNIAGAVTGLAADAEWRRLAVVVEGAGARVWNLDSGSVEGEIRSPSGTVRQALVSTAGLRVVAIDTAGTAAVAALPGLAPVPLRVNRPLPNAPAALSPEGRWLYLAEADGSVGVWDLDRNSRLQGLADLGAPAVAMALSPDGSTLTAASADGSMATWRVKGAAARLARWNAGVPVTTLASGPNGTVAAGLANGAVTVFSSADGAERGRWTAHDGPVTALAWPAALSGAVVSGGADGAVKAGKPGEAPRTLVARGGRVAGLAVNPAGSRVLVAGAAGAITVLNVGDGSEAGRLITTRDGWLAIDPSGRFDGLENTFHDVVWNAAGTDLPVDNFSTAYFQPGLASLLVSPPSAPLAPAASLVTVERPVDAGIQLPPRVTIKATASRMQPNEPAEITVEAVDQGDGSLSAIRLFHNNKRVPVTARRSQSEQTVNGAKRWTETYSVTLLAGANGFRAVALGEGKIESEPASTRIDVKPPPTPPAPPTLRVTAVGINQYDIPGTDPLTLPWKDAKDVLAMFTAHAKPRYAAVDGVLVPKDKTRRSDLLAAFRRLSSSKADDLTVLFLSGHGTSVDNDWYFLSTDTHSLTDPRHIRETGISSKELSDILLDVQSQQIILLIDSCYSGAALGRFANFAQRRLLRGLSRETGVFVLAATQANQRALEYEAIGNGVFTKTLLNAFEVNQKNQMNGDISPADGQVTAMELKSYVEKYVPRFVENLEKRLAERGLSRGDQAERVPFTPTGIAIGRDFTLIQQ